MLAHPTLDLLHAFGLHGMAKGYQEIAANPEARALDHAEWLGLLLEHEATLRRQKRFETRARAARLRHSASIEDVDYRSHRGLDRALFLKLAVCDWIRSRRNLLITGPVEDRYETGSLLITSQVPVDRWYDFIGIPTLADGAFGRHQAVTSGLTGGGPH